MAEAPVIPQQIQALDKRSADVSSQIAGVGDQMQASAAAREGATKPLLEDVSRLQGEASQFIERRQAGRPVIPEFKPQPPVDAKEFQGLSYALIGMAMIGGAVSKGNWLGVADTLNGAMKGFIYGHHELAQKNVQDYEQQFKSAAAKEQQWARETEDVLKSKNMSINQKLTQIRITAAQYDKQDMLAQGRLKSLEGVQKSLDSQKTALTGMQQRHEDAVAQMRARLEARQQHDETLKALRGRGAGSTDGLAEDVALARTGMPTASIVKGWGPQATERWNQIKAQALQDIMKENPGTTMADAAIIFSTEQQEYKASGTALSQLTKDLASIRPFKNMLDQNIDIAIDLSKNSVLTNSRLANKSLNYLRQNMGDFPDTAEYLAQMRFVQTEAARVLNNPRLVGQLTDSARHEMEEVITGDMPLKSTERVLRRIQNDGERRIKQMEVERGKLLHRPDGAAPPGPAAAPPGVDPAVQEKVDKMTPEQRQKRIDELRQKQSGAGVIDFSELAA